MSLRTRLGSSPHTRGLQAFSAIVEGQPGIIPAHAGFTMAKSLIRMIPRDHPRTRGVYFTQLTATDAVLGSSPHTRGLLGGRAAHAPARGIIPAHAGFTPRRTGPGCVSPDHPRTRGVYITGKKVMTLDEGSSPHTRGLRVDAVDQPRVGRIIPAHAGFTETPRTAGPRVSDHPRTRGVYVIPVRTAWLWRGSSPHTRGLPPHQSLTAWSTRIIPAHAGFTTASSG